MKKQQRKQPAVSGVVQPADGHRQRGDENPEEEYSEQDDQR